MTRATVEGATCMQPLVTRTRAVFISLCFISCWLCVWNKEYQTGKGRILELYECICLYAEQWKFKHQLPHYIISKRLTSFAITFHKMKFIYTIANITSTVCMVQCTWQFLHSFDVCIFSSQCPWCEVRSCGRQEAGKFISKYMNYGCTDDIDYVLQCIHPRVWLMPRKSCWPPTQLFPKLLRFHRFGYENFSKHFLFVITNFS